MRVFSKPREANLATLALCWPTRRLLVRQSDTEVQMLVAMLNDKLSENDEACMRLKAQYDAFSYLWLTDM